MNILIITWYFPPSNTMGALRLGKMAKFLNHAGHDVRVLSARDVPRQQSLPREFPDERITLTRWLDVNAALSAVTKFFRARPTRSSNKAPKASSPEPDKSRRRTLRTRLRDHYQNVVNFPDAFVGWIPPAVSAGKRMVGEHRPDVILASGPPFTTLVVGSLLARHARVPFVMEFRDRWAEDPYYPPPAYRAWMVKFCQRWLMRSATGLVTVSEPWAETYRQSYGKPVCTVYNGFDPDDFTQVGDGATDTDKLVIIHTGRIYPGRRDPTPLFDAVRSLGENAPVRMIFLGVSEDRVMPLARAAGVEHQVETIDQVPYEQSIETQSKADILLFMQWNNPLEQGNVPGKLFEYMAARRPILGLGLDDGIPAAIIRERQAGFFGNEPSAIADQLKQWIETKRSVGRIEPLPESVSTGLDRDSQFSALSDFLVNLRDKQTATSRQE